VFLVIGGNMKLLKKILIILLCAAAISAAVFMVGRYGWKLGGFNTCETAGIEQVNVEENHVRIRGFYPGSFPTGFLGYHAEQVDHTLYVGFKFSALFGIFEAGDFDITIPTRGTVTQVVVKSGEHEYTVWPKEDEFVSEAEVTENGIYVRLERSAVYSVGWYFENKSGGMTNADGTALEVGKNIYLDNDVFHTASNLERPVPVMLTFSDKNGKTIAQVNLSYDPQSPVLTATLTADARIFVNGIEVDEPAIPTAYEQIITQYRTALKENWSGQILVDAGLNFMIKDVPPEAVGYAVDDLDDNGIPELAIGTISGDEFYGKLMFELYTLDDYGDPVQIFSSIERNRYYYAGGIRFANLGSSGADSSYVTTLKLEGEGLVDMTFTTDPKDYVQMQFVPIAENIENAKTTSENAIEVIYEGEYVSYDTDEPMLFIRKNEDGTYSIQIGIYRLIQLDHCIGVDKGDRLEFSTLELGENQKITGTIILNSDVATVTLYAPWSDPWFIDMNEFDYYKLNVGK